MWRRISWIGSALGAGKLFTLREITNINIGSIPTEIWNPCRLLNKLFFLKKLLVQPQDTTSIHCNGSGRQTNIECSRGIATLHNRILAWVNTMLTASDSKNAVRTPQMPCCTNRLSLPPSVWYSCGSAVEPVARDLNDPDDPRTAKGQK